MYTKECQERGKGFYCAVVIVFPVSLRNRILSGGLEPVLSHTENFV